MPTKQWTVVVYFTLPWKEASLQRQETLPSMLLTAEIQEVIFATFGAISPFGSFTMYTTREAT